MTEDRTAVMLMSYGTPRTPADILAYYTHIRRGHPPTDQQLADLTARYEAIGGISPLAQRTDAQRRAMQIALDRVADGKFHVTLGMKHSPPFIEESVAELASQGFRRVVGMVLAPHYSAFSVGQYLDRLTVAATEHDMAVSGIESWATEPAFVDFVAAEVRTALATMPDQTRVLFTAHSLPERILESDDPYPAQLQATAQCVASNLGLDNWGVAWQSAGRTPEPWLGPDILLAIDKLAAEGDTRGVLVSAVGFVADHLEVLYDLDIEASRRAAGHGLAFARTACVNDDPAVMAALAGRVIGVVTSDRRIAVIGGGITGLAAAHAIVGSGANVTLFEAGNRFGGMILTTPFAGHPAIDEGADAFLARVPWAVDLARNVALGDSLTSPAVGKAAVWWNGLHDIPDGLLLGLPTELVSLARSPLISRRGKLRAATEIFRPRTDIDADSIGAYVRARFGNEVHERLVDPLIGSIYAADTDEFSLAAIPQLAEVAARSRSVLLASRRPAAATSGPVFYAPTAGVGQLVDAVSTAVAANGGDLRFDAAISELAIDGKDWRVDGEAFDGVVLACPARAAAGLLATVAPSAASTLATIPTAGIAMVTVALPADGWPAQLRGLSGYLVPKPQQRLVTAVSFASQKWAHLTDAEHVILRISLGRDGLSALHLSDDDLLADVLDELRLHLKFDAQPVAVRVSRWPDAFPQYRPHHGTTMASVERSLPSGVTLAGASYHGIGIPACIHSGQQAAAAVLQR